METKNKVRLGATGDILLHLRLIKEAQQTNGTYDFNHQLSDVKDLFDSVDVSVVNQESIIGGERLGYTDFPNFNSPVEIGHLLKDYGVDMVTIANNHVLDRGEEGLQSAIKNWNKIGLPYVGAYASEEDYHQLRVIHKNGLRIGFVSITKDMGFNSVINRKPWLVDHFKGSSVQHISKRLRKIKAKNLVDIMVVSIHFGKEYHFIPTSDQLEISRTISDAGADIILGHHPHVLQPIDVLFNSRGHETFTTFSMGNFFSGQKGVFRQIGGFLAVDIEKEEPHLPPKFSNPEMTLTYCDMYQGYKVRKLSDLVDEGQVLKTHMGTFEAAEAFERMKNVVQHYRTDIKVK